MIQILISGVYTNPLGQPLPDVTISLLARFTSTSVFVGTDATGKTDKDGNYAFNVVPGTYVASSFQPAGHETYLGVIQVYPDSPAGTLNEYLTAFQTSPLTPAILAEMEEILAEAKAAAKAAEEAGKGSITSIVSGNIIAKPDEQGAATLGTAAGCNVQSGIFDTRAGQLMLTGAGGLLANGEIPLSVYHTTFFSYIEAQHFEKLGLDTPGAGINWGTDVTWRQQLFLGDDNVLRIRMSRKASVEDESPWSRVYSESNPPPDILPEERYVYAKSGQTLYLTGCVPGIYFMETGSILENAPTTPLSMYGARILSYDSSVSVMLTAFCQMPDGFYSVTWEYSPVANVWTRTGTNENCPPTGKYTMLAYVPRESVNTIL